uniref:Carboxypeptidase O n=1 Tax=Neogobius melanostomus TaxID=47308 RepID=A0A8C6V2V3_9GOBI
MHRTLALTAFLLCVVLAAAGNRVEYDYFKYHSLQEISKWKSDIATASKNIVSIIEYGKTYENRTIDLLKIGVPGNKKKIIWMDCGIHAREWISPAFCQYFVKTILDKYSTDSKMQQMMKNMDFYVTPVLNVDGYTHTWLNSSTRLWRKNRTPGPPDCNCTGTDLNRNFNANWGSTKLNTNFLYCHTYPGQGPTSELEAQAVTQFVGNISKDVLAFLTIHSYGQMLLIRTDTGGHRAHQDELVRKQNNHLTQSSGATIYRFESADLIFRNEFSGSSGDWARLQGIPYSYTFELRDNGTHGFELPANQIQPAVEEATAAPCTSSPTPTIKPSTGRQQRAPRPCGRLCWPPWSLNGLRD